MNLGAWDESIDYASHRQLEKYDDNGVKKDAGDLPSSASSRRLLCRAAQPKSDTIGISGNMPCKVLTNDQNFHSIFIWIPS